MFRVVTTFAVYTLEKKSFIRKLYDIAILISTRLTIRQSLQSNMEIKVFEVHPVSYTKDAGSTADATLSWSHASV
jgi:hypothetical protein